MKSSHYYKLLVFALSFPLLSEASGPAPFGDIPASLSLGTGQSVRRNAGGTAFEAYTPSAAVPGGSDKQIQYNNANAFGGVPSLTYDGTIPATITLVAGSPAPYTPLTGILLQNAVPAAAGTPKPSGAIQFTGQSWSTDDTASEPIDFRIFNETHSGATARGLLQVQYRVNSTTWEPAFYFDTHSAGSSQFPQLVVNYNASGDPSYPTLGIQSNISGLYSSDGHDVSFSFDGNFAGSFTDAVLTIPDDSMFSWVSGDTGISRNDAGVVEINNGSSGTLAKIIASNVYQKVTFVVDAGGVLTTGTKNPIKITHGGVLAGWTMMAKPSGSVTADIFRAADGAGLPTVSIVGAGTKPAISSNVENSSTSFASWTSTTLTAKDNLAISLSGISTATYMELTLYYQ